MCHFLHRLKIIFFVLLVIGISSCEGCGASGSLSGETTTNEVEPLGDEETELFEDGPIGIPAPIAKVDMPVSGNIDCVVEGDNMTCTGQAGAIADPDITPFVWICDNNQDVEASRETACSELAVAADGSFGPVTIASRFISFYAATGRLSDLDASVSPPFTVSSDIDGNIIFTLTNSGGTLPLRANVALVRDTTGNVYSVMNEETTGNNRIYRISPDGSPPKLVVSSDISVVEMAVGGDGSIVILDTEGNLQLVPQTGTEADPAYEEPVVVDTLTFADDEDPPTSETGNRFLLVPYSNDNNDFIFVTTPTDFDQFRLGVVDIAGRSFTILEESASNLSFLDIAFDTAGDDFLYESDGDTATLPASPWSGNIYRIDLSSVADAADVLTAYNDGTATVFLDPEMASHSLSVSNGVFAYTLGEDATISYNYNDGSEAVEFLNVSSSAYDGRPTIRGNAIFVCAQSGDGGPADDKTVEYYVIGDPADTLTPLIGSGPYVCGQSMPLNFGDDGTLIHYSGLAADDPQVSLFKIDTEVVPVE